VRNTIVLDSSQVSRDHALVGCPDCRDCVCTDLGSVNGTYINGARVAGQQVLKAADLISIGEFRFVFRKPAHKDAETQDELVKVAFVRLYANTTKEDIRKYRDGIAERLGFLGRVTHGADYRNWRRDLESRVGETVDYALAFE
jgi:pSer/pThr/pTyr-binding forkhead associated (FHA) protein